MNDKLKEISNRLAATAGELLALADRETPDGLPPMADWPETISGPLVDFRGGTFDLTDKRAMQIAATPGTAIVQNLNTRGGDSVFHCGSDNDRREVHRLVLRDMVIEDASDMLSGGPSHLVLENIVRLGWDNYGIQCADLSSVTVRNVDFRQRRHALSRHGAVRLNRSKSWRIEDSIFVHVDMPDRDDLPPDGDRKVKDNATIRVEAMPDGFSIEMISVVTLGAAAPGVQIRPRAGNHQEVNHGRIRSTAGLYIAGEKSSQAVNCAYGGYEDESGVYMILPNAAPTARGIDSDREGGEGVQNFNTQPWRFSRASPPLILDLRAAGKVEAIRNKGDYALLDYQGQPIDPLKDFVVCAPNGADASEFERVVDLATAEAMLAERTKYKTSGEVVDDLGDGSRRNGL